MSKVVVTRSGQITLTKDIRKKLNIREGDVIIMNRINNLVMVSKRNPNIFDKRMDFLPDNLEKILKEFRKDSRERFKKLGIMSRTPP